MRRFMCNSILRPSCLVPIAILVVSLQLSSSNSVKSDLGCVDDDFCDSHNDTAGISLLQKTVRVTRADVVANIEKSPEVTALKSSKKRHSADTTTTTVLIITKNTSASQAAGVAQNGAGDLGAFISALTANFTTIGICIAFFVVGRKRYPWVYSGNVYDDRVNKNLPECHEKQGEETLTGWIHASLGVKDDECIKMCGLDHWMLLEFCHMMMKMLGALAIPNLLIMGPCHMFLGGNRAGDDNLSKLGMANVVDGSNLYWGHAVAVWLSVWLCQHYVYETMGKFLHKRQDWLEDMPAPRSNTILVEGLPDNQCSDARLKKYFEDMFGKGGIVKEAFCIKLTEKLMDTADELKELKEQLDLHEAAVKAGEDPPTKRNWKGELVEVIPELKDQIAKGEEFIASETKKLQEIEKTDTELDKDIPTEVREVHNNCGFVTFEHRRDSEIAMKLNYTEDEDEFRVEIPPDPADVIYRDFMVDETREAGSEVLGWCCVAGLFFGYMPIIVGISSVASLHTLQDHVKLFAYIVEHNPGLAAVWDGLVGAMALTLMVSFLPTFLVIIFYRFFALKAEAWLQHRVQIWYYYFNVVFVLLVTAVGSSLLATVNDLIEDPTSIFKLLATTMPTATHFYLNLYPAQWATHSMGLMRYIQWSKYKIFEKIHENDDNPQQAAHDKAEPEDQDYYGMGSRSARFTMMAVIGTVFCTLSPLMTVMAFINFAFCRLFYGYLFNYAEIIKADLGGVFFVSSLKHVQQGMFIYITLMSGVLYYRGYDCPEDHDPPEEGPCLGPGMAPGVIAGLSFLYMIPSYLKFDRKFHWVDLPFAVISADDPDHHEKRKPRRETYQQPELEPKK